MQELDADDVEFRVCVVELGSRVEARPHDGDQAFAVLVPKLGEIGATILDPLTGYNRFRSGDASRVTVLGSFRRWAPSSSDGS